jgi:hypothetical protein
MKKQLDEKQLDENNLMKKQLDEKQLDENTYYRNIPS